MTRPPSGGRTRARIAFIALLAFAFALSAALPAYTADSVVATVPVGRSPVAVAVNPLSQMVYVANYYGDSVSIIDGTSDTVSATVAMPAGATIAVPDAIVVDTLSSPPRAFVANFWSAAIAVIDENALATTETITLDAAHASGPRALAFDPTGSVSKLYVAKYGDAKVGVYDADTYAHLGDVTVGSSPRALGVFSASGIHRVFVANGASNSVTVIDGADDTVRATLPVGTAPKAIAVDPNTGYAYVTNENSNNVTVIDDSADVTATISVGARPVGVAVDPAGRRVFVANYTSGTVSVIDQDSNVVTSTLTVGTNPYSIAFDTSERKAYVTNYNGGSVSVIDAALNVTTVAVGTKPYAVAVNEGALPHKTYVGNWGSNSVSVIDEPTTTAPPPVVVQVDPLAGDMSIDAQPLITGAATDVRSPYVSSIRAVVYRFDDSPRWSRAELVEGAGTPEARWTLQPDTPLDLGAHTLQVAAIDDASAIMSSSEFGASFSGVGPTGAVAYDFEIVEEVQDTAPPTITSMSLDPDAASVGESIALEVTASDTDSGSSAIQGIEYSVDGGAWMPMSASDGLFDTPVEGAIAALGPFGDAGLHVCAVRASDMRGNVGDPAYREFVTYDPSGGSVQGHGQFIDDSGRTVDLRASVRYSKGVLGGKVTVALEGTQLSAAELDWLVVDDGLAVLEGSGLTGDGDVRSVTVWIRDGADADDLARVRMSDPVSGAVTYDSQPGAGLLDEPSGIVTKGDFRLAEPDSVDRHIASRWRLF